MRGHWRWKVGDSTGYPRYQPFRSLFVWTWGVLHWHRPPSLLVEHSLPMFTQRRKSILIYGRPHGLVRLEYGATQPLLAFTNRNPPRYTDISAASGLVASWPILYLDCSLCQWPVPRWAFEIRINKKSRWPPVAMREKEFMKYLHCALTHKGGGTVSHTSDFASSRSSSSEMLYTTPFSSPCISSNAH